MLVGVGGAGAASNCRIGDLMVACWKCLPRPTVAYCLLATATCVPTSGYPIDKPAEWTATLLPGLKVSVFPLHVLLLLLLLKLPLAAARPLAPKECPETALQSCYL